MRRHDLPSLPYLALTVLVLALCVWPALLLYGLVRRRRSVPGEYVEHLERDF